MPQMTAAQCVYVRFSRISSWIYFVLFGSEEWRAHSTCQNQFFFCNISKLCHSCLTERKHLQFIWSLEDSSLIDSDGFWNSSRCTANGIFHFVSPAFSIKYVHIFSCLLSFLMPHYLPPTHHRHKHCPPLFCTFLALHLVSTRPPLPRLYDHSLLILVRLSFHHPSLSSLFGLRNEERGGEQHGSRPLPTTSL